MNEEHLLELMEDEWDLEWLFFGLGGDLWSGMAMFLRMAEVCGIERQAARVVKQWTGFEL